MARLMSAITRASVRARLHSLRSSAASWRARQPAAAWRCHAGHRTGGMHHAGFRRPFRHGRHRRGGKNGACEQSWTWCFPFAIGTVARVMERILGLTLNLFKFILLMMIIHIDDVSRKSHAPGPIQKP